MHKLVVSLAALALTSCSNAVGTTPFTLKLTDAPLDIALAKELKVTIDEVKVHVVVDGDSDADAGEPADDAGTDTSDAGSDAVAATGKSGWKTVCGTQAEFDLLTLTNGKTTPMCPEANIDSGKITQVRLVVSAGTLTWKDGSADTALEVPSGTIKIVGVQTLQPGTPASMTLDFDAAQSVVVAGTKFQLKPTIKIVK
ncbi:MAG: hypothetical protein RL653_1156 [Pseudomonadota bacterium]|jgi:hypothetical protein